jgi:Zn-dependent peptidase ImmA (M78 family)
MAADHHQKIAPAAIVAFVKRWHENQCSICAHTQRADLEEAFVTWVSPAHIAKKYGVSRDAVYRHAHVFGLMGQRRRNIRTALERIIEKAGEVEVNAAAVVSAASAYARINSRGEWVERTETVNSYAGQPGNRHGVQ